MSVDIFYLSPPEIYNGADWLRYLDTKPPVEEILDNFIELGMYAVLADKPTIMMTIEKLIAVHLFRRQYMGVQI